MRVQIPPSLPNNKMKEQKIIIDEIYKSLQHQVNNLTPEKAIEALNTNGIDLIQIPCNILDRKFERAGIFELAQKSIKRMLLRVCHLKNVFSMA